MKKILLTLSICTLISINACANNNSSFSTTSSSSGINEVILGVEIAGAKQVLVGKDIRLSADVLGTNDDSVIWTSSNTNIACVNEAGVVTGISEGEVKITATSVKDSSKFNSVKISVTLPKANELVVKIEDNEYINYDAQTKTYSIPLGQTFYIYSEFEQNTKLPDVSYSIIYPSGTSEDTSVTLEMEENTTRAKVISYASFTGLVIKATGKYNDMATGDLINSIKVNIIDINSEDNLNAKNIVNNFKEKEINSLVSSSLARTKEIVSKENNNSYKEEHKLTHSSYLDATYVNNQSKIYTNDVVTEEKTSYFYQGKNTVNMNDYFYTFEYDNNKQIVKIYNPTKNVENVSLMMDINTSITYGYTGILNNILGTNSTIYDSSIASLGNIYLYAYANYEISNNQIKITSNCFDEDSDVYYTFDFTLNYNGTSITNYSLIETIEDNTSITTYTEIGNDFIYSTKVNDTNDNNPNYLDINKYYMESFELVTFNEKDANGAYDYSNLDKYGVDFVATENGLTKYTTTYDKTIILKINALTPNTANVNIDTVIATSSDTSQIPNVTTFKDGIFAINANKDDNGNSLPGKATFTFKSTLGIEEKIIIEFTKTTLKEVNANFSNIAPTYNSERDTYVFDSIYVNNYSSYFYINTNPDEDIYEFDIDVIEGDETGIELYNFDDSNPYGYPGFSYSILGKKAGTYKFKIYVKGFETIEDHRTFEITVNEKISNDVIKENIIGKSFEYKGFSTITSVFTFTDESTLTYKEEHVDETIISTLNYVIKDGSIQLENTQNFTSGSYFGRINEGEIIFNEDFTELKFHLEQYVEEQLEGTNFFQYYNYTLVIEPTKTNELLDKLNGITLSADYNKYDTLTINDNKGTFIICDFKGNVKATITFDITYDENSNSIKFLNSVSTNTTYTLNESSSEFDEGLQRIVLKTNNYSTYYFYI